MFGPCHCRCRGLGGWLLEGEEVSYEGVLAGSCGVGLMRAELRGPEGDARRPKVGEVVFG